MNLDSLVAVEKANSKAVSSTSTKKPKASKESFSLRKGTTKKGVTMFTLTTKFFDAQQVATNSLKQFNSAEGIAIAVMPGNSGVFMKNTAKGNKGRVFKNDELAASITALGLDSRFFELDFLGEKDGAKYFQLRPVRRDSTPATTEEAAPAGEVSAQ